MKHIRIAVDAPVLQASINLTHYATSYQIAKFPDFSNIDNIIHESIDNEINLLDYRVELDISDDDTVYIRNKYHFKDIDNNIKNSNWSRITPVSGLQKGFKLSNSMVVTPKVSYSISKNNIMLRTEPMRMYTGVGIHLSTSWKIITTDNKVVYNRVKDSDNLTMLIIPNTLDLDKGYTVEVIHHTTTNNDSLPGKLFIFEYNKYHNILDIEFIGNMVIDRKFFYKIKLFTYGFKHIDIEIRDIRNNVVKSIYNSNDYSGYILLDDMLVDNEYVVYSRITLNNNEVINYREVYRGYLHSNKLVVCNNTDYLNKFSYGTDMITGGEVTFTTREHYDNTILLPDPYSDNIGVYEYTDNVFTKLFNIYIGSGNKRDINIIPLPTGDILVNYYENSIGNKYVILNYNPIKLTYGIHNTFIRPNEFGSTANNGSLIVTNDNIAYYVANEEDETNLSIYSLDIYNGTFTKVNDLPFTAITNVSLVTDCDNNIYIFGGSISHTVDDDFRAVYTRENNNIYKYNINTNTFEIVAVFPDYYSINIYSIQSFLRKDGKIVMFNSVSSGTELGNHNTLVFNPKTYGFELYDTDNNLNIPFKSNIVFNNGNILRVSRILQDPQKVMTYIANTLIDSEVVDITDTVNVNTNLVVNSGENITVFNPYNYDSINISGTGTLTWDDNGTIRVFTSDILVVTRDTSMTQAEYDAGGWSEVFILTDVRFVIEN